MDWSLKNGDIEMNITTELFTSGNYIKKIFVEMLDRLVDESALSLLENYDLTEAVFKSVLKLLIIQENQTNERSNFNGIFKP